LPIGVADFLLSNERDSMSIQTTLLCPVDFSPQSRGALHYALAIARRFHARLVVQTVDDPLLAEVGDARLGEGWSHANSEVQLQAMVGEAERGFTPADVVYDVRVGKAAPIILETARDHDCALIVMSTHGRSGVGKFFFGATAERVLRETTVPVLLAPEDPGALPFEELAGQATPMLVPVDFSAATAHQVAMAGRIAGVLHARMMIGHVVERVEGPEPFPIRDAELSSERYRHACRGLQAIAVGVPIPVAPEILLTSGRPAEEIARWASETHAGLLVMALHSGGAGAPRMGSVTYRAIALSRVLTLAVPPASGILV
jgi:nucleotide-binding universal stress UspA family protein